MKRVLCAVAIATVLALTGCAGHGRGSSGLSTTTHTTSGQPASTPKTTPATGGSSISAQLSSIDHDLTGVDSSMSGIDTNITQADKAGDDDN